MGPFGPVTVSIPSGIIGWQDGCVEERDHSGLPIKSLTSPHDRVRSRHYQSQHKLRHQRIDVIL
jgi:hypothetical protein